MVAFALSSLIVGTLLICLFALQRRVRIFRFCLAQREFLARFSLLDTAARERVLARAEGRAEDPTFALPPVPEDRLQELLRMRWQAMRELGEFDFTRLGQDLERLLRA
jgi:hypothetical protein